MYKRMIMAMGCMLFMGQAAALGIDNLILTSGQSDKGDYYTLENNSDVPVYVKTQVSEIHIVDNEQQEVMYNKDNLATWHIAVNPSLFILDPGESKKVAIEALSYARAVDSDELYSITFLPQASRPEKAASNNLMAMQIGFKAFYIVPASESEVKYDITYDKKAGVLMLRNVGNTYVVAELNQCVPGKIVVQDKDKCDASYLVAAGRTKTFNIPTHLRQDKMIFTLVNHDRSYKKTETF